MPNSATWHPNSQASNSPSAGPVPISKLCSLIYYLVECRKHIVGKLYLRHRPHSLCRKSNCKSHYSLLSKRCIEDSITSKVLGKIHRASKDAPKCHIFAKEKDRFIGGEGGGESVVDGLEEVHAFRGAISHIGGELRVSESGLGGVTEDRSCREVCWYVETCIRRMCGVLTPAFC
jgi:hypothetical protein